MAHLNELKVREAAESVAHASDEELLAEFQRRRNRKRTASVKGSISLASISSEESVSSGLSAIDDSALLQAAKMARRSIYGSNERYDYFSIKDIKIQQLARASVALFLSNNITAKDGMFLVSNKKTLEEKMGLCPGEKFAEQPVGPFCSGTLVMPNVLLTAGHCFQDLTSDYGASLSEVRFVFGYRLDNDQPEVKAFSADQVYAGTELLGGQYTSEGVDWALVKLDRSVPSKVAEPITAWRSTPVFKGEKVFTIGFPHGIPLKYSSGADIRDISNPKVFAADLDVFSGGGAGVYDQTTKELVGILARGEASFIRDVSSKCNRLNLCPTSGCRGEEITRISEIPKP